MFSVTSGSEVRVCELLCVQLVSSDYGRHYYRFQISLVPSTPDGPFNKGIDRKWMEELVRRQLIPERT